MLTKATVRGIYGKHEIRFSVCDKGLYIEIQDDNSEMYDPFGYHNIIIPLHEIPALQEWLKKEVENED